jgi:hypothetical protein
VYLSLLHGLIVGLFAWLDLCLLALSAPSANGWRKQPKVLFDLELSSVLKVGSRKYPSALESNLAWLVADPSLTQKCTRIGSLTSCRIRSESANFWNFPFGVLDRCIAVFSTYDRSGVRNILQTRAKQSRQPFSFQAPDSAGASVVEFGLIEVRPESHGLNQVSHGSAFSIRMDECWGSNPLKH